MGHQEITEKILGCSYRVYNKMGFGFLESVYERCLFIELERLGFKVECQTPINFYYDGLLVGEYIADVLVEDTVLVELKSVRNLVIAHEVQLVNYLTATHRPVGLLINFGEKGVEVR